MDRVLHGFLEKQYEEGMELAATSDIVNLVPVGGDPPNQYLAVFHCKGLVKRNGEVAESDEFAVIISFPDNYVMEAVSPVAILTWYGPSDVWHPNILGSVRAICIGPISPGTPLKDLLHRIFEVISYQKSTVVENEALNREACPWARANQSRFPIDKRPLKRRQLHLEFAGSEVSEK